MMKKLISILLTCVMLLGILPQAAMAEDTGDLFTERDLAGTWKDAMKVDLTSRSAQGSGAAFDGDTLRITAEGTWILSGNLNGQVIVQAEDSAKIQLVLSGAEISSSGAAAIAVLSADKVFLTLAEGTENSLSAAGAEEQLEQGNVDAAVWAKADLCINGSGSLNVSSTAGHGIVSKDDLKITGGTLRVSAIGQGLAGKDSIRIGGGDITVSAGRDSLHSENPDKPEKGYVTIIGGTLNLVSEEGDGIDATGNITISGGTLDITTGDGSASLSTAGSNDFGRGGRGGWGWYDTADTASGSVSMKGIKSDKLLTISGGTVTIKAQDDALHSVTILLSGGSMNFSSADDGVHADETLTITGGSITVARSYEGLEGRKVLIQGGDITVYATDDGVNASGGSDGSGLASWGRGGGGEAAQSGTIIDISGGTLRVTTSAGDGLDSNGDLAISGGVIYVCGPVSNTEVPLDYNGSGLVSGGTILATGYVGRMTQTFDSSSAQPYTAATFSSAVNAGTNLTVTDASGNVLASFTSENSLQLMIFSAPGLSVGDSVTFSAGGQTVTAAMGSTSASTDAYGTGFGNGRDNRRHGGW